MDNLICPRRSEIPAAFKVPDHDDWNGKDPRRTCSFCGSLHPDDFFAAIRAGMVIGPTDKNYKAYVSEPLSAERKATVRQEWIDRFVAHMGVSEEEATGKVDADPVLLGEGPHVGKFYFQHLSEDQRREFFDLLQAKSIEVGHPGHFYVLPFFIARRSAE